MRNRYRWPTLLLLLLLGANAATAQSEAKPAPPSNVVATDHPWDGGDQIDVTFQLSPDDTPDADPKLVDHYLVRRSTAADGVFTEVGLLTPTKDDYRSGQATFTSNDSVRGQQYFFSVAAVSPEGVESAHLYTQQAVAPSRQIFDGERAWFAVILLVICGAVVYYIQVARSGRELKVRKIAGLEAVDEAVGRATEMGRSCLFIPGIQDMNDIQTVAGVTVLSRVARVAAEYDAKVEVPTSRALVMTACRETVQSAFLAAGRPDAYRQDDIYYVTDEQFGFVAYLSGMMVREKPAACFYMGSFYAESLILAETGNQIGAIQVAGTAMPTQLPFFVAACDYTLIGEEFFAASAYLSGEPDQLGSLKGQDVGKIIVAIALIVGCILATIAVFPGTESAERATKYLQDTMLK